MSNQKVVKCQICVIVSREMKYKREPYNCMAEKKYGAQIRPNM